MMIDLEFTTTVGHLLRLFEGRYGSVDRLRKKTESGRASFRAQVDLEEWDRYLARDAPETEKVSVRQSLVFHDSAAFFKLLSPERFRVLERLRGAEEFGSIHELARALKRDPKNVHGDVEALVAARLVTVERRNRRRSIPRVRAEKITITL